MAHAPPARTSVAWLLPPAVVLVTTLVAFSRIVLGEFVWDDVPFLVEQAGWRGLDQDALAWMCTDTFGHYQPLTWLSFAVDHALWGLDPHAFRATNLVLHGVNALLVYALALTLLTTAMRPGSSGGGTLHAARWAAAGAALAFAIHPLRVEVVAWSVERRNLLGTGWLLAAVLAYLAATKNRGARWWVLALVCYAASLLSRAGGVVLPLSLAILDVYPLARHRTVAWTRLLVEKLPFALLALPIALVAIAAQTESGALKSWEEHTARERVGQMMYGAAFYPVRTLAPVALAPMHALPKAIDPSALRYVGSGAVALAITVAAVCLARRFPGGLAAWLTYLVLIGPLLGWSQVGLHDVACRYAYAACVPFAIAAGALGLTVSRHVGARGRWWLGASALLSACALVLVSQRMIDVWQDDRALWTRVCEVDPTNAFAHNQLAYALRDAGALDTAIDHDERALFLEPVFPGAAINLGIALAERGRYDEAQAAFERGLTDARRDSERACAHLGLGILALAQGALESALEHLDLAIPLGSGERAEALPARDLTSAHYHKGEVLRRLSLRPGASRSELSARAQGAFAKALAIDPRHGRAHLSAGLTLLLAGDASTFAQAIAHLEQATALRPEMPEAWYGLARAYAITGRMADARDRLARARAIAPPAWHAQLDAFGRELEAR